MNYDAVTLQDCLALYELMGKTVIIENGHITGITEEEYTDELF